MKKTQRGYNSTLRGASIKRKKQLLLENELKKLLFKKQNGLCAKCQHILRPDWWDKHEIVSRARGGDATDESNCELLCRSCHMKEHGINVKEANQ